MPGAKRKSRKKRHHVAVVWGFFTLHSGRIAIATSLILLLIIGAQCIASTTIEDDPSYWWPQRGASSSGASITRYVEPAEIDLKSESLRTLWFQLSIVALDRQSFNAILIWPLEYHVTSAFQPKFENGTIDSESPARVASWELVTRPEKGAQPWAWGLKARGGYPWDEYSFVMLLAFNRTLDFDSIYSGVPLNPLLADNWKVTQSFERLRSRSDFENKLMSIGFNQLDFTGEQRRLPGYLEDYVDYYGLTVTFVRETFEVLRGALAFWVPAVFLAALLIVACGKIGRLKISQALTVFLGIPLAALPFILSALQLLPPRLSLVESLLYGEVAVSIAFAAIVLAREKGNECEE